MRVLDGIEDSQWVRRSHHGLGLVVDPISKSEMIASHLLEQHDDLGVLLLGNDGKFQGESSLVLDRPAIMPLRDHDQAGGAQAQDAANVLHVCKRRWIEACTTERREDEIRITASEHCQSEQADKARAPDGAGHMGDGAPNRCGIAMTLLVQIRDGADRIPRCARAG